MTGPSHDEDDDLTTEGRPQGSKDDGGELGDELREAGHQLAPEPSTVRTSTGERVPEPGETGAETSQPHRETADRLWSSPSVPSIHREADQEPDRRPDQEPNGGAPPNDHRSEGDA